MKDQEIKLQCLSIANGNLDQAKAMFTWITEIAPFRDPRQNAQNHQSYQSGLGNIGWVPGA